MSGTEEQDQRKMQMLPSRCSSRIKRKISYVESDIEEEKYQMKRDSKENIDIQRQESTAVKRMITKVQVLKGIKNRVGENCSLHIPKKYYREHNLATGRGAALGIAGRGSTRGVVL